MSTIIIISYRIGNIKDSTERRRGGLEMICKYCGSKMIKNDVDFRFKGNKNVYWLCEQCLSECIETIRYGKQVKLEFYQGEDLGTAPYDFAEDLPWF